VRPQAPAVDVVDEGKQIYEFLIARHDAELSGLFDRIDVSPPALAGPIILALEACKSGGIRVHDLGCVLLEPRGAAKPRRVAGVVSVQIGLDLSECGRRDLALWSNVQNRDYLTFFHHVLLGDENLSYRTGDWGRDGNFHLHRFENNDWLIDRNALTRLRLDLPHPSGDFRLHLAARHGLCLACFLVLQPPVIGQ
jgi:hypothetical protein